MWIQKFGDEALPKNKEECTKPKAFVQHLQQTQTDIPWRILEGSDAYEIEEKLKVLLKIQ